MSLSEKYRPVAASTSGTCRFPIDWNSPSSRPNKTAIRAARQHASTSAATAPALIFAGVDHRAGVDDAARRRRRRQPSPRPSTARPRTTSPVIVTSRELARQGHRADRFEITPAKRLRTAAAVRASLAFQPRHVRAHSQYLGPTNSSSRATASRFATEIVFGFENRHSTPNRSSVSPQSARMSADSLTNK